jgi:hypothetical protein
MYVILDNVDMLNVCCDRLFAICADFLICELLDLFDLFIKNCEEEEEGALLTDVMMISY